MAGTTTNFSWPFPTNPDVANVASDMQSLASAIDGTLGNAWTVVTGATAGALWTAATVNPTLGNGTASVRYKTWKKTLLVNYLYTMGGTTTFGTGNYSWALPNSFQFLTTGLLWGHARLFDTSAGSIALAVAVSVTATTLQLQGAGVIASTTVSPTVPFTFASGDTISITVAAEQA